MGGRATLEQMTTLLASRFAVCSRLTLSLLGLCATSLGQGLKMDGLLAVTDAASPCLGVRVQVFEEGKAITQVTVLPDGRVTVPDKKATLPSFAKGKAYKLQATCVSTKGVYQNSELSFKAEGRTVMVVFTKSGFQFKRGGLAY